MLEFVLFVVCVRHVPAAARACTGSLHVLAFLLFVARAPVLAFARSSVLAVER